MTAKPDGWSMTVDDLYQSVMVPEKYGKDEMLFVSVASLRRDGSPYVVPLGFLYDREYFYLTITEGRSGIARLRGDPRVCLNFQTYKFPPHFITVTGVAEEIPDPGHATSLRISHRYPKDHAVDEETFDKSWLSQGRVLFRIKPITVAGSPFHRKLDWSAYKPSAHWNGEEAGAA